MQVRTAMAAFALAMLATGAEANEPFYKGKRLSVLINYGAAAPPTSKAACLRATSAGTSTASPTSSCRTSTAPAA